MLSIYVASLLKIPYKWLGHNVNIKIPSGRVHNMMETIVLDIEVCGRKLAIQLILLMMTDFELILGIDWLSKYHIVIDYHHKEVVIAQSGQEQIVILRKRGNGVMVIIVTCIDYVTTMVNAESDVVSIESIVVVVEFPNLFLNDFHGFPPTWEIEFSIDLLPRPMPVLKASYRMEPI